MARSKQLHTYPQDYWDMVKGCMEGKEYRIRVESWKDAVSARGYFYAFRTALRRERDLRFGRSLPVDSKLDDAILAADVTVCWITTKPEPDGKLYVRFFNKENHPMAKLLRTAEVTEPALDPRIEVKLAESAQRLLAVAAEVPEAGDEEARRKAEIKRKYG